MKEIREIILLTPWRLASILVSLLAFAWGTSAAAEPMPSSIQPITVEEIAIRVDDPFADGFDWPALARAVIGLNRGDKLTPDSLARSVQRLSPLAKVQTRIEGKRVILTLQPYKRIKSITVQGNYPLFEQDVRDAMTIAPGDIFMPRQAVAEQHAFVVQRYKTEGYIDPRARIDWEQDRGDGHYHLTVVIEKGPYYTLRQVDLTGNQAIDIGILKAKMTTWRRATLGAGLRRFKFRQLDADIKALVKYYRSQGFADVAITHTLEKNEEARRIYIDVHIAEGPLYEVAFEGNRNFSDEALRKDLALFTIGNKGNIGLYRSIRNIRQRYLQAGFSDVRVDRRKEAPGQDESRRELVIEIHEGRRHKVRSVTITGHRQLDADAIERQMLTRPADGGDDGAFVADVLQEDLSAIQALYLQNGYLGAAVEENVAIDPATQEVDVTIDIAEGVQTRIGSISVGGDLPPAAADLKSVLQLDSNAAYQSHLVRKDENLLAARIASMGYPHVQVNAEIRFSEDRTRADIVYRVETGPLVRVGDLFITGNFRTRGDLLAREAGLKKGTPFDLAKVLASQRNLRDLGLFDAVEVRTMGLKEEAAVVPLLVEVVEKKPYFFEVGGGFESDKGPFARTRICDRNFRGANRQVWLGGEVSGVGHRLDAGISAPHLFGTRIRAALGVFVEREEDFNQDFGTDTYGGSLNFSRRISPTISVALGWRYEDRDQFLREQDASAEVDPEALEPRRILVTTPTLWYDSRDSLIRPRKGWYSRFTMDISNGLDNELDDFFRYQFDLRHLYSPHPRLTLAAMTRVGYLTGDGDEGRVPEDQLFFLGGTTDVRGFDENLLRFDAEGDPLGGRLALSGSLEARYDLGRKFELTLFADVGSLQLAPAEGGTDDWRWSLGMGLGYITPIGPISLFYGHKLDPQADESSGQFHFSIGYTY